MVNLLNRLLYNHLLMTETRNKEINDVRRSKRLALMVVNNQMNMMKQNV